MMSVSLSPRCCCSLAAPLMLLTLAACVTGCADADRERQVCATVACQLQDSPWLGEPELAWLDEVCPESDAMRIVTVYTEPNPTWLPERGVQTTDRVLMDGVVECRAYFWQERSGRSSEFFYRVGNPEAVAMFRNLHKQVALGFRFPEDPEPDLRPGIGVLYAIAAGPETGVTLDIDGMRWSDATAAEIYRWDEQESVGETITDGDLADAYFGDRVFASPATSIILALSYFDRLCELTYESEHGTAEEGGAE
jgi:hypothetical protein